MPCNFASLFRASSLACRPRIGCLTVPRRAAIRHAELVGLADVKANRIGDTVGEVCESARDKGGARTVRLHRRDERPSTGHNGNTAADDFIKEADLEAGEQSDPGFQGFGKVPTHHAWRFP